MSCEQIEPALIGYQLGGLPDDQRRDVEAHLPTCPACVSAFIAIKRAVDTGDAAPRPSAGLRRRLRQSVAVELGLVERPRPRWERPATFAFAASLVLAAFMFMNTLTAP